MCDPCETEDKIRGRFFCCEEAFRALCLWLLEEPRELIRRMGSDTTAGAASFFLFFLSFFCSLGWSEDSSATGAFAGENGSPASATFVFFFLGSSLFFSYEYERVNLTDLRKQSKSNNPQQPPHPSTSASYPS